MAVRRSCVCLLVVLVQVAVCKPFLDGLLCDLVCSDEDSDSTEMFDIFGVCADCPGPEATEKPPQSISLKLPASPNGISLNVTDNNGVLQFILDALSIGGGAAVTTAAAVPVTAAPAAAPAGNTTAAG